MLQNSSSKGIPTATNADHLGVTVPDLQEAVAFFVDALGADYPFSFQEGPGTENPANLNKTFDVDPDSKLKIAMLRLGPTLNLELMEYESPDQRQEMPKNSDYGAPHIAFFVQDMKAAADYLTAKGCRLFKGPFVSEKGPFGTVRVPRIVGAYETVQISCVDWKGCLVQLHGLPN
jgi:catechol 2,3-dioxygenase-like lactoylglutathione lyase family enzyme